jgi:hypothetical protein
MDEHQLKGTDGGEDMEKQPKDRNRIVKENKFHPGKEEYTLEAEKAGDYVPSLNKINKQNNPQ